MISFLKGNFVFKSPAMVYVEVNGVGYEVHISLNTYSKIQNLEQGTLFTHLHIREDAHLLYGFYDKAEKEIFLNLISVSGIGASTARVMLSYARPDELVNAIVTADTRTLENIKGIGKKTAERLIVELKDKLSRLPSESNIPAMKHNSLHQDALEALLALGINRQAAEKAIQQVTKTDPNQKIEDIIKQALKTV